MDLNFKSVIERNFELVYKIPKEVGERYEELTSFDKGRVIVHEPFIKLPFIFWS